MFMDIAEFQEKLAQVCALGEENGKKLETSQIRECFEGMELDRSQLVKILQYLKLKGIQIEGAPQAGESAEEAEEAKEELREEEKKVPLTPEEQAYLTEYLAEIEGSELQMYLGAAAKLAVEMNCEEIYLADLIQEANLSLVMALEEEKEEAAVLAKVKAGIRRTIEEQTQRKFEDDYLVAKVQNLESAVKELTDDEEEGAKFSVDELAVILDMNVDEIRDVLRLTGDDK